MKDRKLFRRMRLENLESRKLMAADIGLMNATLAIDGSPGADVVEVRAVDGRITARVAGQDGVVEKSFDRDAVRRLSIRGHDGNDRIFNGTDLPANIYGGAGDDILIGGTSRDRIFAGDGNDFVVGGAGGDLLVGGRGDDQLFGGEGDDSIYGSAGRDRVMGGGGDDYVRGGSGRDEIVGGTGNDRLYGDDDSDVISGNAGRDRIYGGSGDDRIYGGAGHDVIFGGYGRDSIFGGTGWDYTNGGPGWDSVNAGGSNGQDSLSYHGAVDDDDFQRLVDAAIARWNDAGVDLSQLGSTQFRMADLPEGYVGLVTKDAQGNGTVWVDVDAAGTSWFVDATPEDDGEYTALTTTALVAVDPAATNGTDLLTVLSHEIGHLAGLGHSTGLNSMSPTIVPGLRLLPAANAAVDVADDVATFAEPMFGFYGQALNNITSAVRNFASFPSQRTFNGYQQALWGYRSQPSVVPYFSPVNGVSNNLLLNPFITGQRPGSTTSVSGMPHLLGSALNFNNPFDLRPILNSPLISTSLSGAGMYGSGRAPMVGDPTGLSGGILSQPSAQRLLRFLGF